MKVDAGNVASVVDVGGEDVSVGKGWLDGEQAESPARIVSSVVYNIVA